MTWGEALRLSRLLARDPSSQVCAALSGWQYPASREALATWDHYDAFMRATYKNPAQHPRPWDEPVAKLGTGSFSTADMRALLDIHRAKAPLVSEGETRG